MLDYKIKLLRKLVIFTFLLSATKNISQNTATKNRIEILTIAAPQWQAERKIYIYLPINYTNCRKKYPVIYMHDGQNLFDSKTSFAGEWNIDETLDSISAQAIVVGIENGGDKRIDELTPFKNEKYGGGNADLYLDFLVKTLKPYIDKNYRTKPNANNTCIFGSSLGGLFSFYAALKHPDIFGKVGCFSPSFWFNRKEIFDLIQKTNTFKTKIYFLCGDDEGDDDMIKDLNIMEELVNKKRCECKKLSKKIIVVGGKHNEKLWREGFKKAYLWLF
jgi:predicted alpha/beta superfamily hydrolase